TLQGDRAEVIVQHPPETGTVALRYASAAPVALSVVVAGDDTALASSDGATGEVRIDLAEALRAARALGLAESPLSLRIEVEGDAPVRVEEIVLTAP
ncbi:hypothetical protein, partial [Caldilinea sp.]|uniref:hypothetical protein n=1 Tax=Caldilinea sp. TaxID=2293560 RepID=UPI002C06F0E4|nr:hypothetical protein [Caldilinea sp.]